MLTGLRITARNQLATLLARYGQSDDPLSLQHLESYLGLLEKWNARVNLTASCSWEALRPLVEESIWAASLYSNEDAEHLDVGTGAGFPVLPMKILRPRMGLQMVESRSRRTAFLETVKAELGLTDSVVIQLRLEEALRSPGFVKEWNVVTWKALKLSAREVRLLLEAGSGGVQFWLFHSGELPVADPAAFESSTRLMARYDCPARKGWSLSVFSKRS